MIQRRKFGSVCGGLFGPIVGEGKVSAAPRHDGVADDEMTRFRDRLSRIDVAMILALTPPAWS